MNSVRTFRKWLLPRWRLFGLLTPLLLVLFIASTVNAQQIGDVGPSPLQQLSGSPDVHRSVDQGIVSLNTGDPQELLTVTNTVALQDFGWDSDTSGASGSVTYGGVGGSFAADVEVADLKPSYDYTLYLMDVGITGATSLDTSYAFTTDAQGAATISVAKTFDVADGAPLPAFQVHLLVVDDSIDLDEPLPNPLGIAHPIALACSFPFGFLQLDVPDAPTVALTGDSVPLFNFGWAPGFEGGSGSVAYSGQDEQFEGTLTVEDLKPDFTYTVRIMGSALNGDITAVDMELTTDSSGAGSIEIAHAFPVPEGVPLPAFQVHFLVIDTSETLEAPLPNPLGVENPIVLACLFPLGFLQTGPGPVAEPPSVGDVRLPTLIVAFAGILGLSLVIGGSFLVRRRFKAQLMAN